MLITFTQEWNSDSLHVMYSFQILTWHSASLGHWNVRDKNLLKIFNLKYSEGLHLTVTSGTTIEQIFTDT